VRAEKLNTADAPLRAQVVVAEPLGAETLVTFGTSGGDLVARLSPQQKLLPGQSVTLWLDMRKAHVFDAETGVVLRSA